MLIVKREKGIIKWFNHRKGFGFIERENGESLFVHGSALQEESRHRSLARGQEIEFMIKEGSKGRRAEAVKILDG